MNTTEERLRLLEQECSRLRLLEQDCRGLRRHVRGLHGALAAVSVVALSALLMQDAIGQPSGLPGWAGPATVESVLPPVAEVIRARRFEVVGTDERKFVAAMGTTRDGHGFVETWTATDKTSARIGSREGDGRGMVALYDEHGHELFRASPGKVGGEIAVGGASGYMAARLHANDKGDGVLTTINHQGFDTMLLGANARSAGQIMVFDESGHRLASLAEGDTGEGRLEIRNDAGFQLFEVTVDQARNGQMKIGSAEGLTLMTWPSLAPVEDRGDLPPVPPEAQQNTAPAPQAAPDAAHP